MNMSHFEIDTEYNNDYDDKESNEESNNSIEEEDSMYDQGELY